MSPTPPHDRTLRLPWEGAEALRTALGILTDNGVAVDQELLTDLDTRLLQLWGDGYDPRAGSQERPITLTMREADLVLVALRYTDVMSMEFPFYDMVVETIQFVGDRITDLWSTAEWMTWNDRRATG